jgi:Na+-driven multidrug efflux pump
VLLSYFLLFDLGIGPATTKFVAELLGRGEVEKLPEMVWTALAILASCGRRRSITWAAMHRWRAKTFVGNRRWPPVGLSR